MWTPYVTKQKLTKKQYEDIVYSFFANYVPLIFDKTRRGVWQGRQFIVLDDQLFNFLEVLWQHRYIGGANDALRKIAGSQGNLNTIASRLRKKIEPVPRHPLYIHNSRSQGYWVENMVETP